MNQAFNQKDPSAKKWMGALFMAGFGFLAAARWNLTGELFYVLMAVRDFLAAYFFATRYSAVRGTNAYNSFIAYISTALPLLYYSPPYVSPTNHSLADSFAIIGYLLVTLATIELGDKFGISPAKRGARVTTGVYQYFKHPMYIGYAIAHLGWLLISPINILIYAVAMSLFWYRSRVEERVFMQLN